MKRFVFLAMTTLAMNHALAAENGRLISVSGECLKKVAPDRGTVTLVAQFTEKTATAASKKAMAAYEKIRAAVQRMNLKDLELQTSEYSVQEIFDYPNGKRISRGVQAAMGLQVVTSEIPRLGDVAALTREYEINRVDHLSTFLSPEKAKAESEACLVEAVKNARDKAEKMAAALHAKIGEVQLIDENPQQQQPETPRWANLMSAKSMESDGAQLSPRIESKPELISVNVLVKFGLR